MLPPRLLTHDPVTNPDRQAGVGDYGDGEDLLAVSLARGVSVRKIMIETRSPGSPPAARSVLSPLPKAWRRLGGGIPGRPLISAIEIP
jgi:hypothetical protein